VVRAGRGYRHAEFWPEAIQAGCWKEGRLKPAGDDWIASPWDTGFPFDQLNHPVVGVSWYESLAFCRWLEARFRAQLPPKFQITLPSDAEWEKAARGGRQLPAQACIRKLVAGLSLPAAEPGQRNPKPKRKYPWGDAFDANLANCSEPGLSATSAAGCFPGGISPCGALDLSGNVWQWSRDGEGGARVVRGGAFAVGSIGVRCACRRGRDPDARRGSFGFRVVASPFASKR